MPNCTNGKCKSSINSSEHPCLYMKSPSWLCNLLAFIQVNIDVYSAEFGLLTDISPTPIALPPPPFTFAPLPATHTVAPSFRGLDHTFTGWREAFAPRQPAHPALSSSTTRAPGSLQNFVRGKGSYAPFLPGGLEPDTTLNKHEEEEIEEEEEDGWKTRAPGLKRGAKLSGGEDFLAEMLGTSSITAKARRKRIDGGTSPTLAVSRLGDDEDLGTERRANGHDIPGKKNIDDLLPLGVSTNLRIELTLASTCAPCSKKAAESCAKERMGACRGRKPAHQQRM